MNDATGAKYVLVVKRDRLGQWWKKKNGFVRGQIWEPMTEAEAKAFEGTARRTGYLDELKEIG